MPKTLTYKLTFFSYWHCGSGLGAGAKADALVVKDSRGLPFVPGRTVKGLVREAVATLVEMRRADADDLNRNFGVEASASADMVQGSAFFSDAALPDGERNEIARHEAADNLYSLMASTSIGEDGVAKDHTLRSIEVTVPCVLSGHISGLSDTMADSVAQALPLVRRLGLGRSRGLGRCSFAVEGVADDDKAEASAAAGMGSVPDTVQLVCKLKTDIILNYKSASEGANKTLDFIPGACFLGISAASLYPKVAPATALAIFHSGKVRFGDAHPLFISADGAKTRSLRVPASLFYPKGEDIYSKNKDTTSRCFVHHHYSRSADEQKNGSPMQLKQCRAGFYAFLPDGEAHRVATDTSYALKSAHDSTTLRSMDSQMFGYESLRPGADMGFTVEFDADVCQETRRQVIASLIGSKRVGRSRSAQYGQVEIDRGSFANPQSSGQTTKIRPSSKDGVASDKSAETQTAVTVYADSRLIFQTPDGDPTFQPTAAMLGLPEGAKVRYDMSQVRTFQYSPWNAKRQCFDADRCGIEKGSVFVVDMPDGASLQSLPSVVGSFRSEGFGHVIFNPSFLSVREGENGQSALNFVKGEESVATGGKKDAQWAVGQSALLKFVEEKWKDKKSTTKSYRLVNEFVEKNAGLFRGREFASQWGAVRSIAASCRTKDELIKALFNENAGEKDGYIDHGVAQEKWLERNRRGELRSFIGNANTDVATVVNLASEMAKACRSKDNEA